MDREQRVAQTFVDLVDTLVEDFDLVDLMVLLAERTVELTSAAASGLLLLDRDEHLRLVAATSEDVEHVELFQIQNAEGPCRDCCLAGQPVTSTDLRADADRWPEFVPVALAAGYRNVHAYPLRLGATTVGALGVFGTGTSPPTDEDTTLTRALAHVATIALLQTRAIHDAHLLTTQLQDALNSRIVIEQAKGMLTEQAHIDLDEAFARLRRHARHHNLLLTDVAHAVAGRTLHAQDLSG